MLLESFFCVNFWIFLKSNSISLENFVKKNIRYFVVKNKILQSNTKTIIKDLSMEQTLVPLIKDVKVGFIDINGTRHYGGYITYPNGIVNFQFITSNWLKRYGLTTSWSFNIKDTHPYINEMGLVGIKGTSFTDPSIRVASPEDGHKFKRIDTKIELSDINTFLIDEVDSNTTDIVDLCKQQKGLNFTIFYKEAVIMTLLANFLEAPHYGIKEFNPSTNSYETTPFTDFVDKNLPGLCPKSKSNSEKVINFMMSQEYCDFISRVKKIYPEPGALYETIRKYLEDEGILIFGNHVDIRLGINTRELTENLKDL